jgi:hypothetical protein
MVAKRSHDQLKPIRDSKRAKELGKLGGIQSGIAKREKKARIELMSAYYADVLLEKHKVKDKDGNIINVTGEELLKKAIIKILHQADNSSVSMMREIRDATEGSKLAVTGADGEDLLKGITVKFVKPTDQ